MGTDNRVILKRMDRGSGEQEVAFYRTVTGPEPPLVRCFHAAFDPSDGSSHLLLEDLTETHVEAVGRDDLVAGRGVPPPSNLEAILSSLATFHAERWEDPRISEWAPSQVRSWFADDTSAEAHVARRARELDVCIPGLGHCRRL